uniref:hypothetical protein n=1 Tax=Brucella melitensis TaxID=29459 RepID=UPI001AEE4951
LLFSASSSQDILNPSWTLTWMQEIYQPSCEAAFSVFEDEEDEREFLAQYAQACPDVMYLHDTLKSLGLKSITVSTNRLR